MKTEKIGLILIDFKKGLNPFREKGISRRVSCLFFLSLFVVGFLSNIESVQAEEHIIPPVKDFSFNECWVNPKLADKYFWYAIRAQFPQRDCQLFDVEHYAWMAAESELKQIADALAKNLPAMGDNPHQNRLYELFRAGKIPLVQFDVSKAKWDEKKQIWDPIFTTATERSVLNAKKNFIGWEICPEWGNHLRYMIENCKNLQKLKNALKEDKLYNNNPVDCPSYDEYKKKVKKKIEQLESLSKTLFSELPDTRREFALFAAKYWDAVNRPFDFQGAETDGSLYWAIQWPAILGNRAIITETRYPGRSNSLYQAFTRSAGRMGNIPWGYRLGHCADSNWSVGPFRSSSMVCETDQLSRGVGAIPHNYMRRLLYYWCMGNAAIIRDEFTHIMSRDPEGDGTWYLTDYGHTVQEVVEFSERYPERGTPYTPIGILLAWDNGFNTIPMYDRKSFCFFEFNDGEYMTRELLGRVLYPTESRSGYGKNNALMDQFGASPYGDIYDPLRIDTPKGPLSLELLKNYKVLLAVGQQNIDEALTKRLKEYVEQGGTLILNVKQLEGGLLDKAFIGVELIDREAKSKQMFCNLDGKRLGSEEFSYTLLRLSEKSIALYSAPSGDPLVVRHPFGKGYVITVGSHWMLEDKKTEIKNGVKVGHMLPLVNDLMARLVKVILPFEVRGEHVPERVLYQVNRKGNGWVLSLYNNAGREIYWKAPEKVWLDQAVNVEIVIPPEIRYAVEWIDRNRLSIVRKDDKESGIIRVTLEPGDIRILEIQPTEISPYKVMERVNLALNRPAKASSFNKEVWLSKKIHSPDLAVNGIRDIEDAWWSKEHADSKTHPWLEVDLGEVKEISSINTIFMWSLDNNINPRIYQYYVEISEDGKAWKRVIDETKNMMPAHPQGNHQYFEPANARYVRITTTTNTALSGAQIVELEVYGKEKMEKTYEWNNKTQSLKETLGKRDFPVQIKKAGSIKYLSDLKPRYWKQGYKNLLFDREALDGGPISIRGRKFTKGLGTHSYSEIIYDLDDIQGKWSYFAANVGIDDNSSPEGTVDFVVFLDGKETVRTGCIKAGESPFPLWVSLENAKELKLIVDDCGDGSAGDIADWADARLTN